MTSTNSNPKVAEVAAPVASPGNGPLTFLPTTKQFGDAVVNYGVPSLIAGAGIAGLVATIAELKKQRELTAPPTPRKDVLEVQLPAIKTAGVLSNIMARLASGASKASVAVKNNWKPIAKTVGGVTAAGGTVLAADQMWFSPVRNKTQAVREALATGQPVPIAPVDGGSSLVGQAPLTAGVAATGLIGGYALVDTIIKARRKKQIQDRLEQSKREYSELLGQSLTGPASPKVAAFPLCEEVVRVVAGMVAGGSGLSVTGTTKLADFASAAKRTTALVTSTPALLALAAAVASHQFMYSREKSIADQMTAKKVSPPKEIRLITAPSAANQPAAEPVTATEEEKMDDGAEVKVAEGLETAAGMLLGSSLLGGEDKGKPAIEKRQKTVRPVVERVDANTYRIVTPAGAVTVDATDPNTRHILENDHDRIAELLAGVSTIPAPEKPVV